jgi:hypothetical protein
LLWQAAVRARARTEATEGKSRAIKTTITPITIKSSIRVKPVFKKIAGMAVKKREGESSRQKKGVCARQVYPND